MANRQNFQKYKTWEIKLVSILILRSNLFAWNYKIKSQIPP